MDNRQYSYSAVWLIPCFCKVFQVSIPSFYASWTLSESFHWNPHTRSVTQHIGMSSNIDQRFLNCGCWPLQGYRSRGFWGCHAPLPPDFGRSVNPISTSRVDYAHNITTCPSQIFRPSYCLARWTIIFFLSWISLCCNTRFVSSLFWKETDWDLLCISSKITDVKILETISGNSKAIHLKRLHYKPD